MDKPSLGKLYVVGTPIGNLGDITLRAVETLKRADRILAEDTRRTRTLLNHLGITGKPLASIEAHVSEARLRGLLDFLLDGDQLALVTDAGMPGVSDPGAKFVALARESEIPVEVVPGPSALTAAIALCGLVEGPFYFAGFLPRQGSRRSRAIERIQQPGMAVVLFEAGNRTQETLKDVAVKQPERRAAVCRELTKLHEEVVVGNLSELAAQSREWRGEVVIVLADHAAAENDETNAPDFDDAALTNELASGKTVRDVLEASGLTGRQRKALYARLLELRGKLDER
ncbi:MAG TPA: 16S rRNA (cytidine(1402)-2'-O)-methyltransferase [Polyangiaceae bacterium]|nr:16S rRNA (cytidine(1402)-2'-O)-methyltransferase [Polyangiaceae bacterium]